MFMNTVGESIAIPRYESNPLSRVFPRIALQRPLDSFTRFGREGRRRHMVFALGAFMARDAEKGDLPAIAPAPFADQKMKRQTESPEKWKLTIKGVRLQPRRLPATGK
jgi:hypothetical protein